MCMPYAVCIYLGAFFLRKERSPVKTKVMKKKRKLETMPIRHGDGRRKLGGDVEKEEGLKGSLRLAQLHGMATIRKFPACASAPYPSLSSGLSIQAESTPHHLSS